MSSFFVVSVCTPLFVLFFLLFSMCLPVVFLFSYVLFCFFCFLLLSLIMFVCFVLIVFHDLSCVVIFLCCVSLSLFYVLLFFVSSVLFSRVGLFSSSFASYYSLFFLSLFRFLSFYCSYDLLLLFFFFLDFFYLFPHVSIFSFCLSCFL